MNSAPGTYALVMRSHAAADVQIGRRGRLTVRPGYYVYVGSAFGPGGIRARVSRHFRGSKTRHWHIDYLRAVVEPVCAWCSYVPERLEHDWAIAFMKLAGVNCVEGFGSSDCSCPGHLFVTSAEPGTAGFPDAVGALIEIRPDQIAA